MARTQAGSPAHALLTVAATAGVLLLAGLPILAAACGSTQLASDEGGGAVKALEGTVWKATQIDGVGEVLQDDAFASTAKFAAGTVNGSGGVNSYSAPYTAADDGTIDVQQPVSTLMAGPPKANAQEQAFYTALTGAARFEVAGETLKLFGSQDELLATFSAIKPTKLVGTAWSALAYNNGRGGLQSLEEGSEITALFTADGKLSGLATINTYSATYETGADGAMTIGQGITSGEMGGPKKLMAQEQAYLQALLHTATYEIQGDELWLRDAEGAALAQYRAE